MADSTTRRNDRTPGQALNPQFLEIVDSLDVDELQKRFLRDRWLDQLTWFEGKARYNQRWFYTLRVLTIVGGVIVPALVSLNVRKAEVTHALGWTTFGISLVVALAASLDGFFHYGDRWRSSRGTTEALKAQGWMFFELAGPYVGQTHGAAFPVFAAQVEALVQQDVTAWTAQAAAAAQAVQQANAASS